MAELTRAALREIEALWETGGSPFGSGAGEAVRALLDEVYRQRTDLDQARAERDAANAQAARALAAQNEAVCILSDQSFHHGRLDAAVPALRQRLRQALVAASQIGADDDWCGAVRALLAGTADLDLSEGGESRG